MENNTTAVDNIEQTPTEVVKRGTEAAKMLQSILGAQKNKVVINGRQYLQFADWQTLARFYGVSVGTEWSRPLVGEDNLIVGYEAKAVAMNRDGRLMSSAESACMRDEAKWADKPLFQLRSMAQTRACVKTLKNMFGWVMVLAGYDPTHIIEDVSAEITPKK